MKLLSVKEVEDIGRKQSLLSKEENLVLTGENNRLNGELNKLKISFKSDEQKLEEDFDKFCQSLNSQKEIKKHEILELKEKIKELENSLEMQSLKNKEREISKKEGLLFENEVKIRKKQEYLDSLEKSLNGEKLQIKISLELINKSLGDIDIEKQKIKQEREELKTQESAFISRVSSFDIKSEKIEIEFNAREERCSVQEKLNEMVKAQNEEKKRELLKLQGHIESQQSTLKQAFDLARKKGII